MTTLPVRQVVRSSSSGPPLVPLPVPPRLSATVSSSRLYYPELDGLRAVAALFILFFHLRQLGIHIPGPAMLGQTGVDLFFVLSGFLITSILLRSPQRDWHQVHTFYIRRSLRIFPLYYVFLLAFSVLAHPPSLSFWTYTDNLVLARSPAFPGPLHLWSLAVEEQFYLVWPFLVLFLPRRWLTPTLVALVLGAPLVRIFLLHQGINPFYSTLSRLDTLAAGALLAVLQSRARLARFRPALVTLFALSVLGCVLENTLSRHAGLPFIQVTKYTFITLVYSSLLGLILLSPDSLPTRLLRFSPLRSLGRISYSLYVFHPPIFAFVLSHTVGQQGWLRSAAALLLSLAASLLSWFALERPILSLKDRLTPPRPPLSPAAPVPST